MTILAAGRPAVHPLAVAAFVLPPVAVYAPLGLAPLFILTLVASLALSWRERPWLRLNGRLAALTAALIALCAASALWALDPRQTLRTSLVLAGETFGGMILVAIARDFAEEQRKRLLKAAGLGLAVAIALILVEMRTPGLSPFFIHYPPLDDEALRQAHSNLISRSVVVVAILAVPVSLGLFRQGSRAAAIALLAGAILAAISAHSLAAKLALPTTGLVALAAHWRPRLATRAWAAVLVVVIAVAPLAAFLPPAQEMHDAAPWLKGSSHHRLTIWRFTAGKALEKPIFGWGLDGSRTIPGANDEVIYHRGEAIIPEAQLPLHPHNAALQWWLELGLAGTALVAAFLLTVLGAIARLEPRAAAPCLASFAGACVVAMVSFGIWQSWWQGGLWLMAAILVALFVPKAERA